MPEAAILPLLPGLPLSQQLELPAHLSFVQTMQGQAGDAHWLSLAQPNVSGFQQLAI